MFETKTGFSIELKGWTLEYRGIHENLPLYESLGGEVTAIALVKSPAHMRNSVADEENRILYGPVMIPNIKIFRNMGPNGPENCYWYFSEDTIATLSNNYKGDFKVGH